MQQHHDPPDARPSYNPELGGLVNVNGANLLLEMTYFGFALPVALPPNDLASLETRQWLLVWAIGAIVIAVSCYACYRYVRFLRQGHPWLDIGVATAVSSLSIAGLALAPASFVRLALLAAE